MRANRGAASTGAHQLPALNWAAAAKAGLIAGAVLLAVPYGIPWSGLSTTSAVIMGRPAAPLGAVAAIPIHLGLAIVYATIIAAVARGFRSWRGVLTGAAMGLLLYLANWTVVELTAPHLLRNEAPVVFTHIIFSLFAAAAYKGMTRRKPQPSAPLM